MRLISGASRRSATPVPETARFAFAHDRLSDAAMTRFTVNNQPVEYKMDPRTPLLWALRDASNLTGTKYGCGTGECGACIVDVDGQARFACQESIGALEGTFVTTIEGLSKDRSHPVQQALIAATVPQCG